MKHVMGLVVLLGLLLSSVTCAADKPLCATRTNDILQALQRGDAAAARAHFDARMRNGLDDAALMKIWQQKLPEVFGPYQRAGAVQMTHQGALDVALVPLQFGKGPMTMRVACSSDGTVSGLFLHRERPLAARRRVPMCRDCPACANWRYPCLPRWAHCPAR